MYTIDDLNRDTSLYFGGGAVEATPHHLCKGGGGHAAVDYQRKVDEENKRRIRAATNAIKRIFDNANREAQYNAQRDAVYNLNVDEINRQAAEAERKNRFALARNGLLGGSAQIDSQNNMNDLQNKGLLKAQSIADDSAASLKTADENTRQNLLQLANQGIDSNAAASMATNQLAANNSSVYGDRLAATVGDLFGGMSQAYLTGANAANTNAQAAALRNLYNSNHGGLNTRTTYGGNTGR